MVQFEETRNASAVGAKARYPQRGCEISMSELGAQVAEAVYETRRFRKVFKTRTNQKYFKMSTKQLENFLEQERKKTQAWSPHHSVCSQSWGQR